MELKRQLGLFTAVLIIIADVIGTGIFMTTGSILGMTGSAPVVLALWGIGGLVAISGSLCYAELASIWPEDGGEYVYLKNIFGFLPSFLTGWISLIVGFSASAAITVMTLVWYLNDFFQSGILAGVWTQKILAASILFIFGIVHIIGVRRGGLIQNALTVLKLLIVFSLIALGFYMADWSNADRLVQTYPRTEGGNAVEYGFALMIIMFAYSGWNGLSYIAGEIKNPRRNLPRALFLGSLSVAVIYIALNVIFLMSTPGTELMGVKAVGAVAAKNLFGGSVAPWFTLSISLILLSSASVQMMVGPRVYYAMARDRMIFRSLERVNERFGTPYLAILIQMFLAIFYVFIGRESIESLLGYMGFSLGIFPLLSVIGLVIMRYRGKAPREGFRTPLFPLVPAVFILLTLGMMITSLITWTKTSLFALGVVAVGIPVFYVWQWMVKKEII